MNSHRDLTCTASEQVRPAACNASVAADAEAAGGAGRTLDDDSRISVHGELCQRVLAGSDVPSVTCAQHPPFSHGGRLVRP